jgi:hypothetical protein
MSSKQVIDAYFMEHRAKLLDVAAFLDRIDRSAAEADEAEDFRMAAFREALGVLSESKPHRAKRVLEVFSDHSSEPIESAAGMKGAHGACPELS